MKLIGMREFVLENIENNTGKIKIGGVAKSLHQINEYAKFLSQPLTLGMFVPCDFDGNVLSEPMYDPANEQYWASAQFEYEQAKERVLFEGFTVEEGMLKWNGGDTPFITRGSLVFYDGDDVYQLFLIEDIVFYGEEPVLTQSAIKQIVG